MIPASKALRVTPEQQVRLEPMVLPALKAQSVLKDLREILVHKDHKATLVLKAQLV